MQAKTKYNKYLQRLQNPKNTDASLCLKEKCIALERLRVIAGDI